MTAARGQRSIRAAATAAGISEGLWRQVEAGERPLRYGRTETVNPKPATRAAICRALGWSPDSIDRLLEGKEPVVLTEDPAARLSDYDRQLLELVRENARKLDELRELARTMNNRTYTLLDMIAQVAEVLAADEAGRSGDDPMPAAGGE